MKMQLIKPVKQDLLALVEVSLHQFHQSQKPKYYPVKFYWIHYKIAELYRIPAIWYIPRIHSSMVRVFELKYNVNTCIRHDMVQIYSMVTQMINLNNLQLS